jgi:exonuclease VII small subunit
MNPEFEKLHQSIDARLAELKRHLGDLAMEGEFQKLQAVTEQAKELEQGKDLLRRAERCLVGAERKLEALLRSNHTKAPLTILRVTVSWPRLGVIGPDEVIEERTAADTLQRLFERLAQKVGNHILERAADVIYGDRPVLSRRPSQEWVNPNSGEPYAARNIGTTGWHVITHSSTKQKIELIEAVRQGLGFTLGSIKAEAVARPPQ